MKWNKVVCCIGCSMIVAAGVPAVAQAREVTVPVFHVHDGSSETDGACYDPVYRKEWVSVVEPHGERFDADGKCTCNATGKPGELCQTTVKKTTQQNVLDHYEVSCTRNVSSAEALLKLEQSSEAWSREIELRASCQILSKDFVTGDLPYIWNDGEPSAQAVRPVSENGTYTLRLSGEYAGTAAELTVRNIDRTAPRIKSIEVTTDSDKKAGMLTVMAEDKQSDGSDGCGLAEQPYSWDNGRTWQSDNARRVTENGVYQVLVRDRLGNTSTSEAVVGSVTVTGPEVLYENRPSVWTNGDVTIIVTASGKSGADGTALHAQPCSWDEGKTWSDVWSCIVTGNTTKTVWVRDKYGNITKQTIKVANIDKSAPKVTMQASQTEWITGKTTEIVLTAEASDADSGLAQLPFSWDGGKTWSAQNNRKVEAAGTYQVIVKDMAGNVSSCTLHLPATAKKGGGSAGNGKQDAATDASGGTQTSQNGADKKADKEADQEDNKEADKEADQEASETSPEGAEGKENAEGEKGEENQEKQGLQSMNADKRSAKKTVRRAGETADDGVGLTLYQKQQGGRELQDGTKLQDGAAGENGVALPQNAKQNIAGAEGKTADTAASLPKEPRKGEAVDWKQAAAEAAEYFLWVLAALALLCFFVLLLWFFFTSAEVYTKDRKGKEKLLGRCMVYKKKDGYTVRFGQRLYEKSETGEFIIVFQSIFADMAKGSPLLVKSGDRMVKAVVREEARIQI